MKLPWEIHRTLSEERVRSVCECVFRAAVSVMELRQFEAGDDNWAHGCRTNAWVRQALVDLAASGDADWLEVLRPDLDFEASIDGMKFRVYRDDPENVSFKTSRPRLGENAAGQFEFSLHDAKSNPDVINWRVVRDIDPHDGDILSVSFMGLTPDGRCRARWDLPLDGFDTSLDQPDQAGRDISRNLGKPNVSRRNSDKSDEGEDKD